MNRRLLGCWTGVLFAAFGAACSTSPCTPGSSIFFVQLPGGTDSVTSVAATGACGFAFGGCAPVTESCATSSCACQLTVQVNETTFGADSVCHIRAVSTTGLVFAQDFPFTKSSSTCFAVSGPTGTVTVDFTGAGVVGSDAGAGADADAGADGG